MVIFISSTYLDLSEHRKDIARALERLGQQVICMEMFGARCEEPFIVCVDEIMHCDIFIGIYAHRYGTIPDGESLSITEMEYDFARNNRKTMLCFIISDEHPLLIKMVEFGEAKNKLDMFKTKIKNNLVCDTFSSSSDLAAKVSTSVGLYLLRNNALIIQANQYTEKMEECENINELLECGLLEVEKMTRTDYNQIFLSATSAYCSQLLSVADAINQKKQRYRVAALSGLIGEVFTTGIPLNIGNVRKRKGYFQAVLETRSELVVPIRAMQTVLGVINSESDHENHFSNDIMQRLQCLAESMGQRLLFLGWSPGCIEREIPCIQRLPRLVPLL